MEPTYVIAGHITREYILPPIGQPLLDVAGGSALYAAGGLMVWERKARTAGARRRGLSPAMVEGYGSARHRYSRASRFSSRVWICAPFMPTTKTSRSRMARLSPSSHAGNSPFPKVLLGYQDPSEAGERCKNAGYALTSGNGDPGRIPRGARRPSLSAGFCQPQSTCSAPFEAGSVTTLTLDPSAGYMIPSFFKGPARHRDPADSLPAVRGGAARPVLGRNS